jgi:hypothetical protein
VAEPFSVPPVSTFVVRVWREWSAGAGRWRGCIEHVQSGRSAAFVDLGVMLRFLRCFGLGEDDGDQPTMGEGRTTTGSA